MDLQGAFAETEREDLLDLRGVGGFGDDVLAWGERASESGERGSADIRRGRTGNTEGDGTESDESRDIRGREEHTVGRALVILYIVRPDQTRTALSGGSALMQHRVDVVG